MGHQNTILHQVLANLPWGAFNRLVREHRADKGVRRLDTGTQMIALLYHQVMETGGLRRLVNSFESQRRLYHLGGGRVSRSTLSDANANRPAAVFTELFTALPSRVRPALADGIRECVHLIDSTAVRLNRFSAWAPSPGGGHGAKAHIVYDPDADCPIHAVITAANVNDITAAKTLPIKAGATYVFDLGCYDYRWRADLDAVGCRIVTRFKTNTPLHEVGERLVEPGGAILSDRTGLLPARLAWSRQNPMSGRVREVRVTTETGKILRLLSNDLTSPATVIADLHKRRWEIELFFRWIKQTLKIKRFLGTSENAVRIQITVALIAFLLLRAAREALDIPVGPLAFAALIKANIMHRGGLRALMGQSDEPRRSRSHAQEAFQWA